MKKKYEAPKLFIDEYVPDTMIASSGGSKNPATDRQCWGCDVVPGKQEAGPYCLGPGVPGC
jgi:hypothetical protein